MKTQNAYMPEDVFVPHFGTVTPIIGVEIGVMGGGGSVAMLDRLPNLKLYSIDPWEHREGDGFEASFKQAVLDENYEIAKARCAPYGERSVIIRKRSDDALIDIPDFVDFVFIDGHHEYNQVLRDITNYMKRVRKGGIISGHDYVQVPDVKWAVDKVFTADQLRTGDDFTWWVYL